MFVQLHCNYTINVLLMNDPNVANLAEILHARSKARKLGNDIQDQQMSLTNETGFRSVSKSDETPSKQMLVELQHVVFVYRAIQMDDPKLQFFHPQTLSTLSPKSLLSTWSNHILTPFKLFCRGLGCREQAVLNHLQPNQIPSKCFTTANPPDLVL